MFENFGMVLQFCAGAQWLSPFPSPLESHCSLKQFVQFKEKKVPLPPNSQSFRLTANITYTLRKKYTPPKYITYEDRKGGRDENQYNLWVAAVMLTRSKPALDPVRFFSIFFLFFYLIYNFTLSLSNCLQSKSYLTQKITSQITLTELLIPIKKYLATWNTNPTLKFFLPKKVQEFHYMGDSSAKTKFTEIKNIVLHQGISKMEWPTVQLHQIKKPVILYFFKCIYLLMYFYIITICHFNMKENNMIAAIHHP